MDSALKNTTVADTLKDGENLLRVIGPELWNGTHPTASLLARTLLVSVHGGTFLSLCFYAYVMYSRTVIGHPMFAVLFQEMAMLVVLQTCSFMSLLFSGVQYTNVRIPAMFNMFGIQLHQWTWFTISCLR